MPVTKTAKRALRSSKRKASVNQKLLSEVEIAIRLAKKNKNEKAIKKAVSLTDRAVKKNYFHKNKAARIKSMLGKLNSKNKAESKTQKASKKSSKNNKKTSKK